MVAARVMVGATLGALRDEGMFDSAGGAFEHVAVQEAVMPFQTGSRASTPCSAPR